MNKKILVLGGTGYIGSHLIDALLDEGYSVKVFDRKNTKFVGQNTKTNLEVIQGDITSDRDLSDVLSECDVCFHLISTVVPNTSNLNPIFDIETNLIGSLRLLDCVVKSKIKKFVFLSSGGTVYGKALKLPIGEDHPTNPLCAYGITKLAIEKYLFLYQQLYGLNYVVLRLSNPYGGRQPTQSTQGAIAVFLGKVLRNEMIEVWGDGSIIRDYVHITDVVRAMLCSIKYEGPSCILNIGSGHGRSLNEILEEIEFVTGLSLKRTYSIQRLFDVKACVLDINRARKILDWNPIVDFQDGLKAWWEQLNYAVVS